MLFRHEYLQNVSDGRPPAAVVQMLEQWMGAVLTSMFRLYQSALDLTGDAAELFYQRASQIVVRRPT